MKHCSGNGADHCCVFAGQVCRYLKEAAVPGRRWACGLMLKYNQDWEAVINSQEYQVNIVPLFRKHVWPFHAVKWNCATWPAEGCDCDH